MRWHRDIVCRRWARVSHRGRSGRPPVHRNVRSAVLRLAGENEPRGYRRIHGELAGLGITVAPSTVWQMIVLREYEDFCSTHRPHRTLRQAAPLRPLPNGTTDLDHFRVQRRDRAGGVIHEYRQVA